MVCTSTKDRRQYAHMSIRHHPAALRNRIPIAKVLKRVCPELNGRVLEIGSGTGCHLEYFAPLFPKATWQPSEYVVVSKKEGAVPDDFEGDTEERSLSLIDDVCCKRFKNVLPALALDASQSFDTWPERIRENSFDLVYTSNVFHISPREVGRGIMAGAAACLQRNGSLIIYGPFKRAGTFTSESNKEFDAQLRATNPSWGYWDTDDLQREAKRHGLVFSSLIDMPADNFVIHFTFKGHPEK